MRPIDNVMEQRSGDGWAMSYDKRGGKGRLATEAGRTHLTEVES